ncbi:T-cell immunomodulatory protein isoform X3 [Schistocerca americana]|uniref:T-cell immunomodulatory protein isoform X3 n=1 Tax=Schistocerca americana TaxID=7009 RepID=UPI001F4F4857|nr:T-cell immunomodulatory protein isoform X3 [Schistocerca americana]
MPLINENGELFGLQETMELKEINTIAFAPGVTSHFAVSWSEDNKMSLVTSKGIHIFVLMLIFTHVPAVSADDLSVPVFNHTDGKLAAFGDFDRDGRTDIAVLNRNGRSVEVLLARETEPLMKRSCTSHYCCNFPFEVVAAAPADFDGDTHLDIAISARGSEGNSINIYMVWGGPDGLTCPSDYASPTMSLISQPLILDYDGNTIADIFGTTANSSQFWSFVGNRSAPLAVPLGNTRHKLRIPHSHAFLDVVGDSAADLILSADNGFEIWLGSPNGSYSFDHFVNNPPGTVIGQSLFVDVHLEGDLFHIVPVCFDDPCRNSTLYALSGKKWLNLNPNFKDETGVVWGFYKSASGSPITVRSGDFNMDGHPDLLATMENGNGKPVVLLLENVPCIADSCGGSGRTFTVRKDALATLGSGCDMGAFFDLYQDGVTDVVLSTEDKGSLKAFRNTLDYDANFVKVVVLAAAATDENRGRGGSMAGVRVSYRTTTQEGEHRKAAAAQLSQSAYAALQLPHSTFGLGRTPNFVDRLTVTAGGRSQDFTQVIPNSQIVVIVAPGPFSLWRAQLFVTPSKAALMSVVALSGTCVVIIAIIGALHLRERKEDRRERLQQAHRFHFDAM